VPRRRAGGCRERGGSRSWCPSFAGRQGPAGAPQRRPSRGHPAASPGTPGPPRQGVVPRPPGTGVSQTDAFCCLCTGAVGKPLHLQNKPRRGAAGLCWVPAAGSRVPEPWGWVQGRLLVGDGAGDGALSAAGAAQGRESLCPGVPLAALGGNPDSSPRASSPALAAAPLHLPGGSGKAAGKG